MMTYEQTKRTVGSLIAEAPELGPERLPSAAADYRRMSPAILSEVRAFTLSPEESRGHNRDYRTALLRLVSIECAAGAAIERCRTWFLCLSSLAAWVPSDTSVPVSVTEAAVWTALAGQFDDPVFEHWPDDPDTEATPERVVYRLLTRKAVTLKSPRDLFENRFWEDLCSGIEGGLPAAAARAFRALAAWWLREYEHAETPAYDPENFSTFEPAPNAALAIALVREHMQIRLRRPEHQRFYYVALMLAQAQPA